MRAFRVDTAEKPKTARRIWHEHQYRFNTFAQGGKVVLSRKLHRRHQGGRQVAALQVLAKAEAMIEEIAKSDALGHPKMDKRFQRVRRADAPGSHGSGGDPEHTRRAALRKRIKTQRHADVRQFRQRGFGRRALGSVEVDGPGRGVPD